MSNKKGLIIIFFGLLLQVSLLSYLIVRSEPFLGNMLQGWFEGREICRNCNVVLISLDTLSANHLPCYGYGRDTAPNLCKFGKDNILFKNAYSNAPWTLPSHTSIFTGMLPQHHNVNVPNIDELSPRLPFLPEILQKNGYKTYFYMQPGTSLPIAKVYNRGISEIVITNNPKDWVDGLRILKKRNSVGQKTFMFFHTSWVHDPYILENPKKELFSINDGDFPEWPKSSNEMSICTDESIRAIEQSIKKDLDQKYWDDNNARIYKKIYDDIITSQKEGKKLKEVCHNPQYYDLLQVYLRGAFKMNVNIHDDKLMSHLNNLYDSKIKELDIYLKSVFDFIKSNNLEKNTLILITADHGEEFMEHGEWGHGKNLYDTSLKVPLIVHIPFKKSDTLSSLAESVDIFPTVLSLLGLDYKHQVDGKYLFGSTESMSSRYITSEHLSFKNNLYSIRDSDWKLIYRANKDVITPLELYNTAIDAKEINNAIYTHTDIVDKLLRNRPN